MKQNKHLKPLFDLFNKGFLTTILLVVMLLCSFQGHATHYRYGNIAWSRVNTSTRTITVTVTQAWRRSFYGTVNVGSVVNTGITLLFGDSGSTVISLTATSVNATDDWFYGTYTTTHTYTGTGTSFTLSYTNCCRVSSLMNNADGNFSSQSIVNLVAGNTGSPISSTPPIINLPVGQTAAAFNIPANDPDGGTLTYGLATVAQTSATNPAGLAISSTGNATFNTVGKVAGQLWQGAFVVTDASGSNTVVDFMMQMVAANTPPIFDYSITPANNAVFNINPGQNINFGVKALDVDVGSTVTLSAVGLPTSNFTFTPGLPTTANPVLTTFNFTPSASQLGICIITFTATRNGGVQTSTNLTINVNTNPQFIAPTKLEATNYVILSGVLNVDTVTAKNPDSAVNTRITSGTIPAGATMSPVLPTAFSTTPTTLMSWTPTPANFGPNNISFLATDTNGRIATRNYVLEVNTVPVFGAKSDDATAACVAYSYDITAIDPDIPYGDDVEIVLNSTLPPWLTLTTTGNGTARLSGTPSHADAGTYAITIAAEDLYHHVTGIPTQSFNIIVSSDVISPSTPTLADYSGGECSATPPTPTTTDNCSGTITGTTTTIFPITAQGTTVVTWTFDDGNGNSTTANQNVIVDDVTPPITPLLADVNVGECSGTPPTPTTTDNCAGTISGTTTTTFPITTQGTTVVTWTFDDGNGNSTTADQNVIVDDVTPPATPLLADVNVGECSGTPPSPTTTDNCSGTITGTTTTTFPITTQGTTVVTWTFDDGNGNLTTANQNVIVNDVTPPDVTTLSGSLNANLECSDSSGLSAALTLLPSATDNCTSNPTLNLVSDNTYNTITVAGFTSSYAPSNWSLVKPAGGSGSVDTSAAPNSIQLSGSDNGSGTLRDTRYQITVPIAGVITFNWAYNTTDRDGPAFDPFGYYLNGSFHQLTNSSGDRNQSGTNSVTVAANDTFAFMIRSVDDILGASATVASNFTAITQLCPNEYIRVRTWNFTDASNNASAYFEQTIHVKDTTPPTMHVKNATAYLNASGNASIILSDINDGTTDNCGTITYQLSKANFNCSNLGLNTVTLTATDACGNSSQANANVMIIDALAPVAPILPDVLLGECSGTPIAPTTTDNCAGLVTGVTSLVGAIKTQGTTVVSWRFDDGNGNVTVVNQNFIIHDVTPPTLTPAANQNVNLSSMCTITVPDVRGTAIDNCSGYEITQNPAVGTVISAVHNGTINVVVTATDGVGLTDVKTVVLTAKDVTPPTLTPAANQSLNLTGSCTVTVPDVRGTATDACSSTVITQNPAIGTSVAAVHNGTINVVVTATDVAGNTDVKTVVLTAKDVTPPTISCPGNIVLKACQPTATWTVPSANDNCSGVVVTQIAGGAPGSSFANGTTTTITYKATDLAGNQGTCSFTVTRAAALNLAVDNSNAQLYYGYSLDQTTVIKGTPTGGVGPYTVVVTMNRILACNVLTSTGDEKWTPNGGVSTGNTCPASGPGIVPVSTATVAAGGSYSVTMTLLSNATITVTVTDANGCTVSKTTDVYAEDARCFAGNSSISKVKLCHRTGNVSDPCHEICVSEDAVATHLSHGDYLGGCLLNCATPLVRKIEEVNLFNVIAYPNPSKHNFTIEIQGNLNEKVEIDVYDMLSRLVRHIESNDNQPILFGDNLPSGSYITKVTQGEHQKMIKLIKE